MAARKLATEIDKTLKKVAEGVEQFEDLHDKFQKSQNQPQKEKMEADLKTQIKKLQKLRDQIKTWMTNNDIKDKKPLQDNRRLIETQMERFKATEKEMKTKAFSKEGLIAASRLDPAEKAKVDLTSWLSNQVDELGRQVEAAEAEIEQLAGTGKKKKAGGAASERAAELEHQNERRAWHISRLEIMNRMIENGQLTPDAVSGVKEDIAYFVESNAEEDFEEDEGIYDEFNLDEEEENFGLKDNDDIVSSHDGQSVVDDTASKASNLSKARRDSVDPAVKREEPLSKKASVAARKPSMDSTSKEAASKAIPAANFAAAKAPAAPAASVTSPPKAPAATPLPPIRYAAAAAAAVSPSQTTSAAAAPSTSTAALSSSPATTSQAESSPAPSSAVAASAAAGAGSSSPSVSSAAPPTGPAATRGQNEVPSSPAPAPAGPPGLGRQAVNGSARASPSLAHASAPQGSAAESNLSNAAAAPGASIDGSSDPHQQQQGGAANASIGGQMSDFQPGQLAASSAAAAAVQPSGGGAGTARQQLQAQKQQGTVDARLPSSLADLVTSFESAKQKSLRRDNNLASVHKSLESGFMNLPEPQDSDKPNYYTPRNPWPTPAYYPQMPASIFDNPALYSKLEEDTLFYIFYYSHRNWWRYLAAKELKKQSWRFSTRYATWFRRHAEPSTINEEYEEGSYIYFDYESSWCQRRKAQFRFEYMYLESEL